MPNLDRLAEEAFKRWIEHVARCHSCSSARYAEEPRPEEMCPIGRTLHKTWEKAEGAAAEDSIKGRPNWNPLDRGLT